MAAMGLCSRQVIYFFSLQPLAESRELYFRHCLHVTVPRQSSALQVRSMIPDLKKEELWATDDHHNLQRKSSIFFRSAQLVCTFQIALKRNHKDTLKSVWIYPFLSCCTETGTTLLSLINTSSPLLQRDNLNIGSYQEVCGLKLESVSREWPPLMSFAV